MGLMSHSDRRLTRATSHAGTNVTPVSEDLLTAGRVGNHCPTAGCGPVAVDPAPGMDPQHGDLQLHLLDGSVDGSPGSANSADPDLLSTSLGSLSRSGVAVPLGVLDEDVSHVRAPAAVPVPRRTSDDGRVPEVSGAVFSDTDSGIEPMDSDPPVPQLAPAEDGGRGGELPEAERGGQPDVTLPDEVVRTISVTIPLDVALSHALPHSDTSPSLPVTQGDSVECGHTNHGGQHLGAQPGAPGPGCNGEHTRHCFNTGCVVPGTPPGGFTAPDVTLGGVRVIPHGEFSPPGHPAGGLRARPGDTVRTALTNAGLRTGRSILHFPVPGANFPHSGDGQYGPQPGRVRGSPTVDGQLQNGGHPGAGHAVDHPYAGLATRPASSALWNSTAPEVAAQSGHGPRGPAPARAAARPAELQRGVAVSATGAEGFPRGPSVLHGGPRHGLLGPRPTAVSTSFPRKRSASEMASPSQQEASFSQSSARRGSSQATSSPSSQAWPPRRVPDELIARPPHPAPRRSAWLPGDGRLWARRARNCLNSNIVTLIRFVSVILRHHQGHVEEAVPDVAPLLWVNGPINSRGPLLAPQRIRDSAPRDLRTLNHQLLRAGLPAIHQLGQYVREHLAPAPDPAAGLSYQVLDEFTLPMETERVDAEDAPLSPNPGR